MDSMPKDTTETFDKLGYRLTPQRTLVLEAVEESSGHVSVEEIFDRVRARFPRVNLSTIYRTLDLLEQIGMVTKSDLGAGRVQYHRSDDANHHHLVCQRCGGIVDLDENEFAPIWERLEERYNFKIFQRHMAIFGECARCRGAKR